MEDRVAVTLTTREKPYWNMAKVFLRTMREHDPDTCVRMYMVNCTKKDGNAILCLNRNTKIVYISVDDTSYIGIMKHRMPAVLKALQSGYKAVAFMDHDMIIRKPLGELWSNIESDSICVRYRPDWHPAKRAFQAGLHVLGNGAAVRKYYAEVINRSQMWEDKYETQKQLYLTWRDMRGHVKLVEMPQQYNDYEFHDESHVWHCKGSHFKDKKFQKEFRMWVALANDEIEKHSNHTA